MYGYIKKKCVICIINDVFTLTCNTQVTKLKHLEHKELDSIMEFSAKQIAEYIQGIIVGDENATVHTFAKIEEGVPGAYFFSFKS